MLTFDEAREFINNASKRGSVLGLESIENLMEELGWQDTVPMIHIAGTNGKGSVGAYLASIFREAGLHVARYTSPAVFDPLEVWQFDGENISQDEYAQIMSQVKSACDIMASKGKPYPTVFEIETAAAFLYFHLKRTDIALVEVGMGGSTDATNIMKKPLASVITTISFDHMQFLGGSLKEIAEVKAGIIKPGCPVFSADQVGEVTDVLLHVVDKNKTTIKFVDDDNIRLMKQIPGNMVFSYGMEEELILETKMAGSYQMKNAALAVECARSVLPVLMEKHFLPDISWQQTQERVGDCIKMGIGKAFWPGRFEITATNPYVILDGAHNEDAAIQLAKTLQNCFTNKRITYIIGVLADKEHEKMLHIMLPMAERVYTVTPHNPRAMEAEALAEEAKRLYPEKSILACKSCKEALTLAKKDTDVVLAFGSLSYLSEMKALLKC